MFVVSREEEFKVHLFGKDIEHIERYQKYFLDDEFVPVIRYIEEKGLVIQIPTILDGWDASFIHRKLSERTCSLGRVAEELSLFIYMRLQSTAPIEVKHSGTYGSMPLQGYH